MTDYSSCNHYHFQFILVGPASHGGFERPQNYPEFTGGRLRKLYNTMDCYWNMFFLAYYIIWTKESAIL